MRLRLNNRYSAVAPVYIRKSDSNDVDSAKPGTIRKEYDGMIPFPQGIIRIGRFGDSADLFFRVCRDNAAMIVL